MVQQKVMRGRHTSGGGDLVAMSYPTLATPWTIACQVPLSTGFSRQGFWSGLPFPSPGDLPEPGVETVSRASLVLQADSLQLSHLRKLRHSSNSLLTTRSCAS